MLNFNFEKLTNLAAENENVQSLAFVGDAVHTLFVRTSVMKGATVKSGDLHKRANAYVKASSQSAVVNNIFEMLTETEKNIFKRARNYKTNSVAKNAKLSDYKRATGFEAVVGYLYLTHQKDRLLQILNLSMQINIDSKSDAEVQDSDISE